MWGGIGVGGGKSGDYLWVWYVDQWVDVLADERGGHGSGDGEGGGDGFGSVGLSVEAVGDFGEVLVLRGFGEGGRRVLGVCYCNVGQLRPSSGFCCMCWHLLHTGVLVPGCHADGLVPKPASNRLSNQQNSHA